MTDIAAPTHADWIERARTVRPPMRPFCCDDRTDRADGVTATGTAIDDGPRLDVS